MRYTIVDLGKGVGPLRVNDKNAVVGSFDNSAFLYENGTLTNLGVYPGDTASSADDINDAGAIVGQSSNAPIRSHAVVFHPGGTPTLLYASTTQNPYADATSINSSGTIAGWIGGGYPCGFFSVIFNGNGKTMMVNAGEFAVGIDEGGAIVGYSNAVGVGGCNGESTAYEFNPTNTLPFPKNEAGVTGVVPRAIAKDGTVVGWYDFCNRKAPGCDIGGDLRCSFKHAASCGFAGYVYRGHRVRSVYSPILNDPCLVLNAINGHGEMVGAICRATRKNPPAHAVRVAGLKVTDLNSLLPPGCSWVLHNATDVNGFGVIVGTGSYRGAAHGFMLIPSV